LFLLLSFLFVSVVVLGQVTTFVGTATSGSTDGIGTNAKFKNPSGVAINPVGTLLYVTDFGNKNVRIISMSSGNCTALAYIWCVLNNCDLFLVY
jgi:DNA-binding beta-propeller fold protein YncE